MDGLRVTRRGVGARAGLLALALAIGAGMASGAASAEDKKAAKPAAKPAAAKPAPAAAPAASGDAAAPAGDPNQSAWLKLCEKAPTTKEPDKKLSVCLTLYEALDPTGMVAVSAALREVEGQPQKIVMVMVPLGVALMAGARLGVDENEPVKLNYTLCQPAGCTAETEATPALVEQMNKGKKIVIAAMDITGKTRAVAVPLVGFDKALAGEPVNNEKYKEARKRLITKLYQQQVELAKKAKEEAEAKGEPATKKQ